MNCWPTGGSGWTISMRETLPPSRELEDLQIRARIASQNPITSVDWRWAGWVQDITWSGSLCVQQYASAPMDPSTAAAWRDLYIGTVGAGASLTGLTFVAIALDPHQIERTPLLRLRAASALWCFVSVMFHRARGPYAQTLHHGGVAG